MSKEQQQQQQQQQQEPTPEDVQDTEIADLYEDGPGTMSEDEPESQLEPEPPDDPPKPPEVEEPAEPAPPKGEKPPEKGETEPEAEAEKKPDGEPGEPPPPPVEYAKDEQVYKVVTSKGAREVPVKDLATTYQQYQHLQQQHLNVKPILDFAKSESMPQDLIWPIFAYGIEAYRRDLQAQQSGQGQNQQQGNTGEYDGPFKDATQEQYFAERDPDMHAIIKRQHEQVKALSGQLERLSTMPQNQPNMGRPQPQHDPQADQARMQEIRQEYERKVNDWVKDYSEYFKPDPQTGKSERLDAFLQYMGEVYPHWRVSELDSQRLSAAFAGFDPAYYSQMINQRAKAKEEEIRRQNRQLHAESDAVRSSGAPQLTDQEKEIADMFVDD